MGAIGYINTISSSLILIISVGGGFSCLVQAIKMITADDEYDVARTKKNIRNIIIGIVVGISISGLINYIVGIVGGQSI